VNVVERVAESYEQVLDALVAEYVDLAPTLMGVASSPETARRAMHTLGGICGLLRCAAGGVGADDPEVLRVAGTLVDAERARRTL
jgi:hypothetical protein